MVAASRWEDFENGKGMYSTEHEDLFTVSDMYKMFLEGDQDGDYNSEEYETYLAENHAEKLTAEEFEFVIQNYKVARRCYSHDRYQLTESFKKELTYRMIRFFQTSGILTITARILLSPATTMRMLPKRGKL